MDLKMNWRRELDLHLQNAKPFSFTQRKDDFGWSQSNDGLWHYTAFVECGRVTDEGNVNTKTALYEIAKLNKSPVQVYVQSKCDRCRRQRRR